MGNSTPVKWNKKTAPSGRLLAERLKEEGYDGPDIIWGRLNNKREALEIWRDNDIPIPPMFYDYPGSPSVGRPDFHSKGRYMYFSPQKKYKRRPTHWLEWIEADREFRVHVVYGKVIKLSEKTPVGNFKQGESYFHYPSDFPKKKSLRELAVRAVEALGFDFGAVDVLWTANRGFFVLEVNTAPCLTNEKSDTLQRYVEAFCATNSL